MKKYIYIGAGGFLGAGVRYAIKMLSPDFASSNTGLLGIGIPLSTLSINVLGSFLIAVVLTAAFEFGTVSINMRLAIATGFIGAFTTFSTLCKETVVMINRGNILGGALYILLSIGLGLGGVYLGNKVVRGLLLRGAEGEA